MGPLRKVLIYVSIYLCISTLPAYSKSICILIDMSGSMKYYGDCTEDISSTIRMILEAGKMDEYGWTLSGGES